jgi:tetratricopeptide (TPR) repeat protein
VKGFSFLLPLLLAACAANPPSPAAPKRLQAIEANNRAAALFSRGDYAGAVGLYKQALDMERSVENEDGIAANLINLSIAYQRLGDRQAAAGALGEILEAGVLAFPPQRVAEAALRDSILKLDAGEGEAAARSLERARAGCGKPCLLNGKLLNMEAQLAYARREYPAAGAAATRALAANREQGEREEIANSLRLVGASSLEQSAFEKAETALREALEMDKDLALPPRILRDLILLGRAAQARGDAGQARAYLARALSVARAVQDEKSVAEVTRLASSLPN